MNKKVMKNKIPIKNKLKEYRYQRNKTYDNLFYIYQYRKKMIYPNMIQLSLLKKKLIKKHKNF